MQENKGTNKQQNKLSGNDEWYDQYDIHVDPNQSPLRIDKFLMDRLNNVSRNKVQNSIRVGSVLVNEKQIKPNYKVRPSDQIKVVLPRPSSEGRVIAQNIPLDIRYEDEDLLIVHKPAGLVVHPGIGHKSGTLVNALAYHMDRHETDNVEGNYQERMGLVHRIDKNTSGLLVVAKNEYALAHLAKQFYDHTIERTYYALIWGEPDETKGTVNAHLGRDPRHRKLFTVFPDGDSGKWAVTHYEVIEPMYYVSLIKCNLETGRTHQIRVHMKHKGHPLFNDERYGGDRIRKGTVFSKYKFFVENCFAMMPRHALHAKSLGFIHPRTEEKMKFDSELPADFNNLLGAWRNYVHHRKEISSKNNLL
ncbi:MAG: RluA family pseudouridine synthase [Bacteroidota bacterium]